MNNNQQKHKKRIAVLLSAAMLTTSVTAFAQNFDWANEAVQYCTERGILQGMGNGDLALGDLITNEQTARLLTTAFAPFMFGTTDIDPSRWSYPSVIRYNGAVRVPVNTDNATDPTTREEFVASLVLLAGLDESDLVNRSILKDRFADADRVSPANRELLGVAVEQGYLYGADGRLNPTDPINRAQACSLLYQAFRKTSALAETPLICEPSATVEQAIQWAKNKGAARRFVDVAPLYWKYGELTGIDPAVLYAQAAKETAYGNYGGLVLAEQNNWAGIKKAGKAGEGTDGPDCFESFATPEDGVRGHFNHMCAYLGLDPIGEPHARYFSVCTASWAGTIRTAEEMGKHWCPDENYAGSILNHYLAPLRQTAAD